MYPGGTRGKESACQDARDRGWMPGLGRSLGGESGNPLQYSSLANPMDRGAWWAMAHGVTKSQTRLSTCARGHTHTRTHTHARTLTHARTHVHTCAYMHTRACAHMHAHMWVHVHACAYMRSHTYTHVRAHTHTHTLCTKSASISSRSHNRPRT